MFRKKEADLMNNSSSDLQGPENTPGKQLNWRSKAGNSSLGHISAVSSSPSSSHKNNRKLDPPPFVSPGQKKSSTNWKTTGPMSPPPFGNKNVNPSSANWDKSYSTPQQPAKAKVGTTLSSGSDFGELPLSPSPPQDAKPKSNGTKSWKDNISFQASSPGALKKAAAAVKPPTPVYYGGSYMNKGNDLSSSPTKKSTKMANAGSSPAEVAPDIKIEVNVDIQEKIRARRAAAKPIPPKHENIPEHIRKAREREERRRRAEEEKEYRSASLVQAAVLGWYARVQYPKLLEANRDRLREIRKREAMTRRRQQSAIKIQSVFRMYMPRKRYVHVRECKRRRERNKKEMKKIEKTIEKMPKKTKTEIKEMKKEYAEKKKELKRTLRKELKEDDEKLEQIKKSGQDMIEYVKGENEKLKQQQLAIKAEQKVLEKQFELLTAKSEEIARNFKSLQEWVEKKNVAIQKHEMSDQKCRHRYLPKYRQDLADRNQHCIAEYRVKELYRKGLKKIVKEIEDKSTDRALVQDIKKEMKACQKELAAMTEIPMPEGLANRLK
jgi:hypothetical protein